MPEYDFSAAWSSTVAFLPKLAMFVVILAVGYFVARLLARGFDAVLERTGFDRMVERGGVKQALARTPYDASGLLSKLLFYTVFLFVLQLAFGVFGPNPVSELLTLVIAFLPRILVALVITVIAAAVGRATRDIVGSMLAGLSYGRFLANAAAIAIVTIGVFAALSQVGIAPAIVNALFYAVLAVVAGSAIVAIGGGGIAPMRGEWERVLGRLHEEMPRVRAQLQPGTSLEGAVQERQAGQVAPAREPLRH